MKVLFDFYVFSNIHVAIAGFCLTAITLSNIGVPNSLVPLFVAFAILLSYNFIRFYQVQRNLMSRRKVWFYRFRIHLIAISLISLIGMIYILIISDLNIESFAVLMLAGVLTCFYVVPVRLRGKDISIRSIPGLKIFNIAAAWALMTVLFPIYFENHTVELEVLIVLLQRFIFVVVITLPFDIRDMGSDLATLKSIPQLLGITGTRLFGFVLLLVFIVLEVVNTGTMKIWDIYVVAIVAMLALWYSRPGRSKFFESFWVEGLPLLWFFMEIVTLQY